MAAIPEEGERLVPERNGLVRLFVWIGFTLFLSVGNAPLAGKFMSCLLFGLTIGFFSWTVIDAQRITRGWSLFIWPLYSQNWKLSRFASIDTGSEDDDAIQDPTGWLTFLLFGFSSVLWPIFGWLLPWAGGPYRLALRRLGEVEDELITIWAGNREADFRQNLKTLQKRTGLPLGRA